STGRSSFDRRYECLGSGRSIPLIPASSPRGRRRLFFASKRSVFLQEQWSPSFIEKALPLEGKGLGDGGKRARIGCISSNAATGPVILPNGRAHLPLHLRPPLQPHTAGGR